jgi:hypothetical protein
MKKYMPLCIEKVTAARGSEVLTATIMKIHVCFDAVSRDEEICLEDMHPQATVELRKLQDEDKL